MKAICTDDVVIDCTDYKAIDSGIVLLDGEDGEETVGFVPSERLEYVLPDEYVEREHERLGLPAPEITSPADLEDRLSTFADEIDRLREHLDEQVEAMIDQSGLEEPDPERQERINERRRTIDRLLSQVRQRAQQFQQLSAVESEGTEAGEPRRRSVGPELDERLRAVEQRIQQLTGDTSTESEAGDAEPTGTNIDDASINGLGSTYRSRLHDAGIDTVEELAQRSPEEVSDVTNASSNRTSKWIDSAQELVQAESQTA